MMNQELLQEKKAWVTNHTATAVQKLVEEAVKDFRARSFKDDDEDLLREIFTKAARDKIRDLYRDLRESGGLL